MFNSNSKSGTRTEPGGKRLFLEYRVWNCQIHLFWQKQMSPLLVSSHRLLPILQNLFTNFLSQRAPLERGHCRLGYLGGSSSHVWCCMCLAAIGSLFKFFICIQQALYGIDVDRMVKQWQAKDWPSMAELRITKHLKVFVIFKYLMLRMTKSLRHFNKKPF